MRRVPLILITVGVIAVAASIPAIVLGHEPASLVATSRNVLTTALSLPSPSARPGATASALTEPTQAAQRQAAAAVAAAVPPTAVTARISIPRIGIRNALVYDRGIDATGVMLIAPGYSVTHYGFSAPFGTGNAVLYGHDDIQGNIFGHLYDLRPGDTVQIIVGGETQSYRVTGHQIVAPTAVSILAPTLDVRLTIITCWPFNVDNKRWIVTAVRV
jgi:sortase A